MSHEMLHQDMNILLIGANKVLSYMILIYPSKMSHRLLNATSLKKKGLLIYDFHSDMISRTICSGKLLEF